MRKTDKQDGGRLHAIVHGRVQGVNFRYYTQQRAMDLGLDGTVANRADGTVEVFAEGPRSALDALLQFLREGPSLAEVDQVDIPLCTGWNLIGYPATSDTDISSVYGSAYVIWKIDNGNWYYYTTKPGLTNRFTTLTPGHGYWINKKN